MKEQCEFCGKPFWPSREWQRFDTKECQQAWNRRRYRQEKIEALEQSEISAQDILSAIGVAPAPDVPVGFQRRY